MDVDVRRRASSSKPQGSFGGGKSGARLEAGGRHERLPFRAVRTDVSSVELAGREVGQLVAEDFPEESVRGTGEVR
jgi:hypothetical protein